MPETTLIRDIEKSITYLQINGIDCENLTMEEITEKIIDVHKYKENEIKLLAYEITKISRR